MIGVVVELLQQLHRNGGRSAVKMARSFLLRPMPFYLSHVSLNSAPHVDTLLGHVSAPSLLFVIRSDEEQHALLRHLRIHAG